ncbi:hypothetical protein F5D26_09785 [Burkholderia pseudomallei]|nr:hypothetical protein F5D26_09785 [Burkholderia pseudomallei]
MPDAGAARPMRLAARGSRHSRAAACVACGPPPAFAAEAPARLGEAPNGRSERRGSRAKSAARCAPCDARCAMRAASNAPLHSPRRAPPSATASS